MSKIDTVQLTSLMFSPNLANPSGFTPAAAVPAYPTASGIPTSSTGQWVFDNRTPRVTALVLAFAVTSGQTLTFDVTAFSRVNSPSGTQAIPTLLFSGTAAASAAVSLGTEVSGGLSVVACDSFPSKTYEGSVIKYIEPADGKTFALIFLDLRGADYALVRLANASATAQILYGVN